MCSFIEWERHNSHIRKGRVMPPSGFNEKAIVGLLQFVEGCYDDLQRKLRNTPGLTLEKAIEEELADIRTALESFSLKEYK